MKCIPAACCSTGWRSQWRSNTGHYRWQDPRWNKLQYLLHMPKIQRICHRYLILSIQQWKNHSDAEWRFFLYSLISHILKSVVIPQKKWNCPGLKQQRKTAASCTECLPSRGLQKTKPPNKPKRHGFTTCNSKSLMVSFLFSICEINNSDYLTVSKDDHES